MRKVVCGRACRVGSVLAVLAVTMSASAVAQLELSEVTRAGEPGFRALFTMDRDGGDVRFLVAAPQMISTATPEWSHDGRRIAMDAVPQRQQLGASHIFVADLQGEHRGRIRDLGPGNVPTWSPDDQYIACMLNPGNPQQLRAGIWMMRSDGSDRQWVCQGWYPRWSPDGHFLCIQDVQAQPNRLSLYDTRTGNATGLLGDQWVVEYSGATWMPGGRAVLFVGHSDSHQHVALCNVSEGESSVEIVYTEPDPNRRLFGPPTASPDGRYVVFSAQDAQLAAGADSPWHRTYLYRCDRRDGGPPILIEGKKVGTINRGMMWSPDGTRLAFSSER